MEIDREAVLQVFFAEAEETFLDLEAALIHLEAHPEDRETMDRLFRGMHSLKGDAASLGFARTAELAHAVENVLERLRSRALLATGEIVTLLLQSIDALRDGVFAASVGDEQGSAEDLPLFEQLASVLGGEAESPGQGPASDMAERPWPPSPPAASRPAEGSRTRTRTLRVDIEKLDRMLSLVGEITIARNRLTRLLVREEGKRRIEVLQAHEEADRLFVDLQGVLMEARMVPIGETFRGYARAVRDLARTHGKLARLVIEGQEVEVDSRVVEHVRDPLTHMIGNAIDHGIEPPAERAARGKDPCGRIVLRAHQEAGSIVVQVSDDGAGMSRARSLARARAQGIVGELSQPSDEELYPLVFSPGFSTTDAVTSLSGRGVGMDVVRRNVEAVRGSVSIQSREGEGCTITLHLPLTLAIIDGFTVGVGDETYVLPHEAVTECLDLPEGERRRTEGQGLLMLRGRPVPYVRLRSLFAVEGAGTPRESVVVIQHGGERIGLVVDELHGKSQTVIKPLGPLLRDLPGVSGSTILGDGSVALILDIAGVCRRALMTKSRVSRSS